MPSSHREVHSSSCVSCRCGFFSPQCLCHRLSTMNHTFAVKRGNTYQAAVSVQGAVVHLPPHQTLSFLAPPQSKAPSIFDCHSWMCTLQQNKEQSKSCNAQVSFYSLNQRERHEFISHTVILFLRDISQRLRLLQYSHELSLPTKLQEPFYIVSCSCAEGGAGPWHGRKCSCQEIGIWCGQKCVGRNQYYIQGEITEEDVEEWILGAAAVAAPSVSRMQWARAYVQVLFNSFRCWSRAKRTSARSAFFRQKKAKRTHQTPPWRSRSISGEREACRSSVEVRRAHLVKVSEPFSVKRRERRSCWKRQQTLSLEEIRSPRRMQRSTKSWSCSHCRTSSRVSTSSTSRRRSRTATGRRWRLLVSDTQARSLSWPCMSPHRGLFPIEEFHLVDHGRARTKR